MAAGGGACVVISGEIWGACACALLWRVDGSVGELGGVQSRQCGFTASGMDCELDYRLAPLLL
jgi:hypothetical protein